MSSYYKCPYCPCIFFSDSDLKRHMGAIPEKGEEHLKHFQNIHKRAEFGGGDEGGNNNTDKKPVWRKGKFGEWCFASEMPKIASLAKVNGKVTMGGFDITLDRTGKYLNRRFAR